jgi:hypothetical protein
MGAFFLMNKIIKLIKYKNNFLVSFLCFAVFFFNEVEQNYNKPNK